MSLTIVTASFQFYIVALIAQGLTGLPRIEAISILYSSINSCALPQTHEDPEISILYSSINRNGEYPLMIHLCYFNSI